MGRPVTRLAVVVLAGALGLVGAPGVRGGPGAPGARAAWARPDAGARVRDRLRRGRGLYEEQEYRRAVRELAPVVRDPAATRAQRLEALELLGLCAFILGEEARAREYFEDLLAIDAGSELREASGSPKIREFFEEVKAAYVPGYAGRARLEHAAPEGGQAGRALEMQAEVTEGRDLVREVVVRWRRRGRLEYRDAPMARVGGPGGGALRARFTPPADRVGYVLEYYLEGRDLANQPAARIGGPETPLSLTLRGAPSLGRPWYTRWYVWAGVGLAAGSAAAITGVVASDRAPDGSLGTIDLGER